MSTPVSAPTGAHRPPLPAQALVSGAVGGLLLVLAATGAPALLVAVAVLQLVLTLGLLALVEAPAATGVFALAVAAAVAADVVVTVDDGEVDGLIGVVALGLVAGLLHQLLRRERSRVTESLADTFLVVVVVCAAACLPAAVQQDQWPLRAGLAAAAVALVAGRVGDAVVHRPALAVGATRAWPGLLLALGAGAATATLVAGSHLSSGRAALVGLAAAGTVAAVDLAIDLAAAELTAEPRDQRRVAALRPVSLLAPYALLGPVLLTAVRLLDRG